MESWEELIDYLLPRPEKVEPIMQSSSTNTALYSAKDKPDPQYAPRALIFDHPGPESILSRAKDALRTGLAQFYLTSKPPNIERDTERARRSFRTLNQEADCAFAWFKVADIATTLIEAIFAESDLEAQCAVITPDQKFSQRGDFSFEVENPPESESGPIISIKFKTRAVLQHHWGSPPNSLPLNAALPAERAQAIFIQLSLQMSTAKPPARFGMIYTGHTFVLIERYDTSDENRFLLVSPIYSVYESDGADIAAPILACLMAFACSLLEGFQIRPPPESLVTAASRSLTDEYSPHPSAKIQNSFHHHYDNPIVTNNRSRNTTTTTTTLFDPKPHSPGPLFDGFRLGMQVRDRSFDLAYNVSGYSSSPSPVLQVAFTPFSTPDVSFFTSRGLPLPHSDTVMQDLDAALPSNYSRAGSTTIASDKSNPIRDFLMLPPTEPTHTKLVPLPQPTSSSCRITLQSRIGQGRTGTVWQADIDDGNPARRVVKMISVRHIASVVRESLFYEHVFQSSGLAQSVPKYYGTYAACHGGWFAIVLEDVGKPVEDMYDSFQEDDELLVRELGRTFEIAGVQHRDIRPPNVLRGPDGELRLIDFGYSTWSG